MRALLNDLRSAVYRAEVTADNPSGTVTDWACVLQPRQVINRLRSNR